MTKRPSPGPGSGDPLGPRCPGREAPWRRGTSPSAPRPGEPSVLSDQDDGARSGDRRCGQRRQSEHGQYRRLRAHPEGSAGQTSSSRAGIKRNETTSKCRPSSSYWDGTTSVELVQVIGCARDDLPRSTTLVRASALLCTRRQAAPPVRERLLRMLPDGSSTSTSFPPAATRWASARPRPRRRPCCCPDRPGLWPWPRSSAPVALGREPPPVDQRPGGWLPDRGGALAR